MNLQVQAFEEGEAAGQALAAALGAGFGLVRTHRFPDGELLPTVPAPAPTVVVYRSLDRPDDKLVELVLACEAWRRLGARRLVLAAPYLAYMRQDRAFEPGEAISQRAIAKLLAHHFDRLVCVDPHLHRIHRLEEVFGAMPAASLSAGPCIGDWLRANGASDVVLLGPDEESAGLVRAVAERLRAPWRVMAKTRHGDRSVDLGPIEADAVRDREVMLVDDICSSGATLMAAAREALNLGARKVRAVVVHALFDDAVAAGLKSAGVSEINSTDAVTHGTNRIRLAPMLAEALADEGRE